MKPCHFRLSALMVCLFSISVPMIRAADQTTVRFRAVWFDPRETPTPEFFVAGGKGKRKPLDLDKSRLSEIQKAPVRTGGMVDFFLTQIPENDEKPAVTLTLPADFSGLHLLVFAPAGAGYQAWAISLPPDDFPAGGTLLANLAPVELGVRIGDAKTVNIKPSKHGFIGIPKGYKNDMIPIRIYQKNGGEDAWRIVQSTRWAVDFRFRSYVFFYQPANGRLMLHGITERID
jgi:hypothetical protein